MKFDASRAETFYHSCAVRRRDNLPLLIDLSAHERAHIRTMLGTTTHSTHNVQRTLSSDAAYRLGSSPVIGNGIAGMEQPYSPAPVTYDLLCTAGLGGRAIRVLLAPPSRSQTAYDAARRHRLGVVAQLDLAKLQNCANGAALVWGTVLCICIPSC
jgi:hypothetical protein